MKYINRNDILTVFGYSGQIMIGIGLMCLIPIIIDLIYFEFNFLGFLIAALISIILGYSFDKLFKNRSKFKLKHAMMVSSFAWLWASLIGGIALTFITQLSYIESVFENMSALTGSGITMFTDVESLPYSVLFFRSFEQWVGGLGVVIMVIGVLTRPGTASAKLYQSEAHEERIKPSIKNTLKKTFKIYSIYTIAGIIAYLLAGMPTFDSICLTFTSISTGGMGIKNANLGYYNNYTIYIITMILMILGATSFIVHYKIIKTRGKSLIKDLQFKIMISIIIIASILIYFTSHIVPIETVFTVISAITTTGAAISTSKNLALWPSFTVIVLMTLMLIGGSNGSTVGAIKLVRVITFIKGVYRHIKEILSPEGRILPVKISDQIIPEKGMVESGMFITLYLTFILISLSLFCLYGYDPFKSLFGIISLQGNIGLELGIIDHNLTPFLKIVSIFNMWIGRLEIYPVLILFRAFLELFRR